MHVPSHNAKATAKRSLFGWWALASACLALVQLLGLIHQTQHVPQRAATSAPHVAAQRGFSAAFEHAAHDHAAHKAHDAHDEHHNGDLFGHDQDSVSCQLFDIAAGSLALLGTALAAATCLALFACPLLGGIARLTHTRFALYSARAPPARLA